MSDADREAGVAAGLACLAELALGCEVEAGLGYPLPQIVQHHRVGADPLGVPRLHIFLHVAIDQHLGIRQGVSVGHVSTGAFASAATAS